MLSLVSFPGMAMCFQNDSPACKLFTLHMFLFGKPKGALLCKHARGVRLFGDMEFVIAFAPRLFLMNALNALF